MRFSCRHHLFIFSVLLLHLSHADPQPKTGPAPLTTPPSTPSYLSTSDCELQVLAALNQTQAFNSMGYVLTLQWQPVLDPLWERLGCLHSLAALNITGAAQPLPDAWASNQSFPSLQALTMSGSLVTGKLKVVQHCMHTVLTKHIAQGLC